MKNHIYILRCLFPNWGDSINVPLIEKISGKKVISMNKTGLDSRCFNAEDIVYAGVGSIMGWCGHPNVEVWGSGFISSSSTITHIYPPKKIHAIRGALTREILLKKGINCPAVFGDPVLLMPRFYNPKLKKKYELSVIPHHIDKVLIPKLKKQFPKAHFIDIQQDVYKFIDEVIQSKYIISSALHGLICADAYGVPNEWQGFSNRVLGKGFKFWDYESSKKYINLDKLYEVCPFRRNNELKKRRKK